MKTRHLLVFLNLLIFSPFLGHTQETIDQLNYDTIVNGIGGSDNSYNLTFPRFDPDLGTLTDVKIISVLTLSFQYEIENTLSTLPGTNHRLRILRSDEISSTAFNDPVYLDYTAPKSPLWLNHHLPPSDGVSGSGPDFLTVAPFYLVNHDTIINQSADNPANFLGSGNITFDYLSSMSRVSNPASGADITNAIALDNVKFVLQYTYISNISLATNITSFSANKKGNAVIIDWLTKNERSDRYYELMKSTDGKNFTSVKKFSALPDGTLSGNYGYSYTPANHEKGRIYFRLKQMEKDGVVKYSALRVVDMGKLEKKSGFRLVPNPARGSVRVLLHNSIRSDYDVQLFNIKGQVIRHRRFPASLQIRINTTELQSGIYFVMIRNTRTNEKSVERLVVQ